MAGGIFISIFKKGKVNKDEIYRSIKKYEERDCLALDGKHFPVKKMVIAQNAPLMHHDIAVLFLLIWIE